MLWKPSKQQRYQALAFAITYLVYASFHASRKPLSVVMNVLHPSATSGPATYNSVTNPGWAPFNQDLVPEFVSQRGFIVEGAGSLQVNGLYTCTPPVAEGEICSLYVNDAGIELAFNVSTNHCWSFMEDSNTTLYFQETNPESGCKPLPQAMSEASSQGEELWELEPASGAIEPRPRVRPNCTNGKILLGVLDSTFLVSYSIFLFVNGVLGDVFPIKIFLSVGMIMCGTLLALIASSYSFKIHSMGFFVVVFGCLGCFQAVGWPCVMSVMGSWFGHSTRGGAMGVWNSHTSIGNILGSLLSVWALRWGMYGHSWPSAYFLQAGIMATVGILVFVFLVPTPSSVGLPHPDQPEVVVEEESATGEGSRVRSAVVLGVVEASVSKVDEDTAEDAGVIQRVLRSDFVKALFIPGVIQYSFAFFFSKLVFYTFVYWLPLYLSSLGFSTENAGILSVFQDIGGIAGGVTAGFLSDAIGSRSIVVFIYLTSAAPLLLLFRVVTFAAGTGNLLVTVALMLLMGIAMGGPFTLMTTAVSADLGTHPSLRNNKKLISTVSGIIDGTGSMGAAAQGIVIGILASKSWNNVFYALIGSSIIAALLIFPLMVKDVKVRWCSYAPLVEEDKEEHNNTATTPLKENAGPSETYGGVPLP